MQQVLRQRLYLVSIGAAERCDGQLGKPHLVSKQPGALRLLQRVVAVALGALLLRQVDLTDAVVVPSGIGGGQ